MEFFLIFLLVFGASLDASQITQTVKGRVVDQETRTGLAGANVVILDTEMGAATDANGHFRIPGIPIGRYSIKVMYMGYQSRIIPEILVGSGKEVVKTIGLEEKIIEGQAVSVTPKIDKSKPLNSQATVSARSFSVEETRRYAGGLDDPARLASSFAGVTYGNAQDNAIIIRGNAPKGLLWRLEGIEIPNPNHFPGGNVIGGGLVTIFSNQLLDNSDFFTGAFPAEYGNALSGVFDMSLRNGNSDVREYTFQTGLMGIDLAAEGPFPQLENASYLVNYRYSAIGLLTDLQVIDTEQNPRYQDLSFKLNFPTHKIGTVSLWGIGSVDRIAEIEQPDSAQWETNWDRVKYDSEFRIGAIGLNHKYLTGTSTYINTTIATTGEDVFYDHDRLDDALTLRDEEFIDRFNGKTTFTSEVTHKFSPQFNSTTGIIWSHLFYDMTLRSTADNDPDTYQTFVDESGSTQFFQGYTQTEYRLYNDLRFNAGVHYGYFLLNSNASIEPRAGVKWKLHPRHSLSFGYGRHSQLEGLQYYLAKRTTASGTEQPNKDLDFARADHFVFGYDFQITKTTRIKIEPYYQYLFDIPVKRDAPFSFINLKNEFYINEPLVNEGTGKNIGIDVTLERFLNNDYYYLMTASVFDSKYTGGDGVERDSRYNRQYVVNALGGKEFHVKGKNILGVNGRLTWMGGERTSPVLRSASLREKRTILDESRLFEGALDGNFYLDLSLTYRMNSQNLSHIFALQVKNILGSADDYGYVYNIQREKIEKDRMVITLPSISYKIEF